MSKSRWRMPKINGFKVSINTSNAWITGRFSLLQTIRLSVLQCYLLAMVLMVIALWIRLLIAPVESGLQYLTFFPAVAIAAIIGGYGPGLVAVAIGLVLATYIFTPPYYELSLTSLQISLWSNSVFLIDGLIVAFSIEAMHRYRQRYTEELRISKESEEWLRVASVAFDSQLSMIITDADNVIVRVNKAFTETSGYSVEELIGQKPDMLKSGRHDDAFYAAMWKEINKTGTWQGELWDRRKNGEIYPKLLSITAIKNPQGQVTHYVGAHTDISERKSAEERIRYLAFYDPLTQLPNRRLLLDRLHQAIKTSARSGNLGALLFIDLDNFKLLNDTMGHDKGDQLLQQVAQRLQHGLREEDTVARLGGDEFVLMLHDLGNKPIEAAAQTRLIGEKILANLVRPYQLGADVYRSSASIGAALFSGTEATPDEIMKQADIAMYQAKNAGRNALRFFEPQLQDSINQPAIRVGPE